MTRASEIILRIPEAGGFKLFAVHGEAESEIFVKDVPSLEAAARLVSKMEAAAEDAQEEIDAGKYGTGGKGAVKAGIWPEGYDAVCKDTKGQEYLYDGLRWTDYK
jgi:hypothetical protein